MFKWHGKDNSGFWLWVVRRFPRKLIYWTVIQAFAKYTMDNPSTIPANVRFDELTKYWE